MTPTVLVALVVVPHEGRYLLVEETDGRFYLPAGKVEPGEDIVSGAARETREEAGVAIGLHGILGIEHDYLHDGARPVARLRFALVGHVAGDPRPKRDADHHSRGARWVAKPDVAALPLRHPEVLEWIERYERAESLLPCEAYRALGLPGLRAR